MDGQQTPCHSARLDSQFGSWSYGLHPHGYDSWWFAEEGGGGAVTLPFVVIDGELLVGLIAEDRPNMGGRVLCAIGGFLDMGESHHDAGVREATEEAGLACGRLQELPGLPVVSNRALFVANPNAGEGVHLFALPVPATSLSPGAEEGTWRQTTPAGAEVREIVFLPWRTAVLRCADSLALAAIARRVGRMQDDEESTRAP